MAGTLLLISGNLAEDTARLGVLRDLIPLSFIEASLLAGSVAGLLLIVISQGLYRKLYRAWVIAMILMAAGIIASLQKGLDWEEAAGLVFTAIIPGAFRSAFYRVEGASVFRLNTAWIISLAALLAAVIWVGSFAYSHIQYRGALWWDFALHGDASRVLQASLVAALVLAAIALNSILMGRGKAAHAQAVPGVVRQLAAASEDADKEGKRCAFYAVSPRFLATYLDLGLSILKLGEVGRVDLRGFT